MRLVPTIVCDTVSQAEVRHGLVRSCCTARTNSARTRHRACAFLLRSSVRASVVPAYLLGDRHRDRRSRRARRSDRRSLAPRLHAGGRAGRDASELRAGQAPGTSCPGASRCSRQRRCALRLPPPKAHPGQHPGRVARALPSQASPTRGDRAGERLATHPLTRRDTFVTPCHKRSFVVLCSRASRRPPGRHRPDGRRAFAPGRPTWCLARSTRPRRCPRARQASSQALRRPDSDPPASVSPASSSCARRARTRGLASLTISSR